MGSIYIHLAYGKKERKQAYPVVLFRGYIVTS